MSTYRVGNHQPQNVYRGEQYIGVMFTAEDAALAVSALNGTGGVETYACPDCGDDISHGDGHVCNVCGAGFGQLTCKRPPHTPDSKHAADSCTCDVLAPRPDPTCIVHQGRRARGPKPLPLGPGCICDGSGRTCPRHGAVS